jgi:hypothetical protein
MDNMKEIEDALKGMLESFREKEAREQKERQQEKEREKRRKELYHFFYEKAAPMTFFVPKGSSILSSEGTLEAENETTSSTAANTKD